MKWNVYLAVLRVKKEMIGHKKISSSKMAASYFRHFLTSDPSIWKSPRNPTHITLSSINIIRQDKMSKTAGGSSLRAPNIVSKFLLIS